MHFPVVDIETQEEIMEAKQRRDMGDIVIFLVFGVVGLGILVMETSVFSAGF